MKETVLKLRVKLPDELSPRAAARTVGYCLFVGREKAIKDTDVAHAPGILGRRLEQMEFGASAVMEDAGPLVRGNAGGMEVGEDASGERQRRLWAVTYIIQGGDDGGIVRHARLVVPAEDEGQAERAALEWIVRSDAHFDERIDPRVSFLEVEEAPDDEEAWSWTVH